MEDFIRKREKVTRGGRELDRRTYRRMERWENRWMDGWMDGWMDRSIDRQTDGQRDGWIGPTYKFTPPWRFAHS